MSVKVSSKTGSIGTRIAAVMVSTVVFVLAFVGIITYVKVADIVASENSEKIDDILDVMDAGIDDFFKNLSSTCNLIGNLEVIMRDDDTITSYIDLSDPSGKVPMNPANFTPYETEVYNVAGAFVSDYASIEEVCLGFESAGNYIQYPSSDRKNGYDARVRSWYTSAKAKGGKVDISDAYQSSNGVTSILISRLFNDVYGKPRGVLSLTSDISFLTELLEATANGTNDGTKFMMFDRNGTILVDQLTPENQFKVFTDIADEKMKHVKLGSQEKIRSVYGGTEYEFVTRQSKNNYLPIQYIVSTPVAEVDAANSVIMATSLQAVCIALIVSILCALILSRCITRPLKNTVNILRNISEGEGDLSKRLPENGNDETTLLAKYFNKTIEKVGNTVTAVIKESVVMKDVARDLNEDMTETASAVNEISANVNSIKGEIINQSAGVEQTNTTMKNISENITRLTENIDRQTLSVKDSSNAIDEMVSNIKSVTDILDKNQQAVNELADSADSGRLVVDKTVTLIEEIESNSEGLMEASNVIQNIASQTNLLAMNAAIEAAHAGDVGKGFAVVADEIRKLAEDSSTQGKRISSALEGLKDLITNVANASKEIQTQFNVIFENTKRVSQQEIVIKQAMDKQTTGSQMVISAMHSITDITNEVKEGAVLMEQSGKEISVEMDKLAAVTAEISGSMNEMTDGIVEINNAMQSINDKTVKNSESINRLDVEINKFKV